MLTVAYLGPEKTNTHLAAMKYFGRGNYIHQPTIDDVFERVEHREAHYGVVPIENSLGGAVTHTLDRYVGYMDTPARIHGEIDLSIEHGLISRPKVNQKKIEVIFSHPQAFEQCNAWLHKHFPNITRSETDSTAAAVQRLVNKKIGIWSSFYKLNQRAAIGPKELSEEYGLKWTPIPQERENRTRFLILGLGKLAPKGLCKTSILVILQDKAGALYDALAPFKRYGINLTKIESRPSRRRAWEYVFFIDFQGHESERNVQRALKKLERSAKEVKVLGSYPVKSTHGRG